MHDPHGTAGRGTTSSGRHWLQAADVPRWMIPDLSDLAAESAPALRCYLALTKRANFNTGTVSSTYEQVAEDAKMARGRVAAGIAKLIELGWIEQISKGKQHRASTYQLRAESAVTRAERAADLHERVSSPEIGTAELTPVDNSPSSPETETPESSSSPGFVSPAVLISGLTTESFQRTTNQPVREPEPAADSGARQGWMDGSANEDESTPGSDLLRALSVKLGLPLGGAVIRDLAPAVDARLRFGWKSDDLLTALGNGLVKAANPIGALRARVATGDIVPMKPAGSSSPQSSVPPPCGECEGRVNEQISTRLLADGSKCPRCHPGYRPAAQVIQLEAVRQERTADPFDQVLARLGSTTAVPS